MSDFRGKNGVRIKTFDSDNEELINNFLYKYDGHIINIQNAKGKIVVVYEDINNFEKSGNTNNINLEFNKIEICNIDNLETIYEYYKFTYIPNVGDRVNIKDCLFNVEARFFDYDGKNVLLFVKFIKKSRVI